MIIFFPFPGDRLWRACLDTIKCAPSIPNHYHCLVIMADDEAQKNVNFGWHKMQFSVEESAAIWAGPINWCPSAPARSNMNQRRGMGSPQLPDDVVRSSQCSVRESGQSSPLEPFQGSSWSLQLQASRPLPRKSHGTSVPARFLFQLAEQCQALYQVSEFISQPAMQIEEIFEADK